MAEALLAGVPDDARGPLLLGRAFLAERRWTEADQALREAVRLEPELAPALRLLGHARAGGGRFEEAVQAWRTWLDLPSRPPEEDRHLASIVRLSEAARTLADAMRGVV
jgi:cytochrome c-type biogenesis protein CcmH/NrfG